MLSLQLNANDFGIAQHVRVESLTAASRAFREWIEANDFGASDLDRGAGRVRDGRGKPVGTISYNGRITAPDPYLHLAVIKSDLVVAYCHANARDDEDTDGEPAFELLVLTGTWAGKPLCPVCLAGRQQLIAEGKHWQQYRQPLAKAS